MAIVLSHYQTAPFMKMKKRNELPQDITTSADLNKSQIAARIDKEGLHIDGLLVNWKTLKKISGNESACFYIDDGIVEKLNAFSEETNRAYSLYPTSAAPTMLVGGFPMHRIKDTDPMRDTLEKIKAVQPVAGHVLDTCTGLGYTAIEMARYAESVTTIELDPGAQEICRDNPWSRDLFENPRITQRIGDAFEVVPEFLEGQFGRIIHDPPTFALAGHLYSAEFYTQLHRILTKGGKLFHYIGDPDSRSGSKTTRGVVERLKQVGFNNVKPFASAYGVVAKK